MLEAVIGAAVGAVLGAVGTWIVSRSERVKAEQAASKAAEQAANSVIAAELAGKLGSMCSPFTPDAISGPDITKMRHSWAVHVQTLELGSFGATFDLSDLNEAVNNYLDTLADFRAARVDRIRVEQRRALVFKTFKDLTPKAAYQKAA